MKKAISLLSMLLLLLCTVQTCAFADIVDPLPPPPENNNFILPVLLIAVAIIVVAVVIWKARYQKK